MTGSSSFCWRAFLPPWTLNPPPLDLIGLRGRLGLREKQSKRKKKREREDQRKGKKEEGERMRKISDRELEMRKKEITTAKGGEKEEN